MPNPPTPPAAPEPDTKPVDAASQEPASVQEGSAPAAGSEDRELRNAKAQAGREIARAKAEAEESRRLVAQQSQQIEALKQQVGQITGHLGQEATRRRDAYLASLPPDQRTAAELKMLREDVAALRARPPVEQAQPARGPDNETLRLARGIIEQYADDFDLDDGTIDLKDPRLVWDSEDDFRDSVRRVAKQAAKARREDPVAKKAETAAPKAEDLKREARQEILQEMGISRPTSARPVSPRGGSTSDDIATLHAGYKAKGGMRGQLERLREIRDAAQAR